MMCSACGKKIVNESDNYTLTCDTMPPQTLCVACSEEVDKLIGHIAERADIEPESLDEPDVYGEWKDEQIMKEFGYDTSQN